MAGRDTLSDLLRRLDSLEDSSDRRVIIGITGAPGAGKTTLVEAVLQERPDVAWIPMDGFHLADSTLRSLGLLDRKGAIETFDGYGYLATLARLRNERANVVYAPEFDRVIEQPIAAGVAVPPSARVILTEGNYLLDALAPWPAVRDQLDEVWYCDAAESVRRDRLIDRHVRFGKTRKDAIQWVDHVDEPNARRIAARRHLADLAVDLASESERAHP
jgi:pantothenate kinase